MLLMGFAKHLYLFVPIVCALFMLDSAICAFIRSELWYDEHSLLGPPDKTDGT